MATLARKPDIGDDTDGLIAFYCLEKIWSTGGSHKPFFGQTAPNERRSIP